jgi:hypothetical protein
MRVPLAGIATRRLSVVTALSIDGGDYVLCMYSSTYCSKIVLYALDDS